MEDISEEFWARKFLADVRTTRVASNCFELDNNTDENLGTALTKPAEGFLAANQDCKLDPTWLVNQYVRMIRNFSTEDRIREGTKEEVWRFYSDNSPFVVDYDVAMPDCDGFLVAEYQGRIIGAVAMASHGLREDLASPTIAVILVLPAFRRHRVATRLFVHALKRLLLEPDASEVFCNAVSVEMVVVLRRIIEKPPPGVKCLLRYKTLNNEGQAELGG